LPYGWDTALALNFTNRQRKENRELMKVVEVIFFSLAAFTLLSTIVLLVIVAHFKKEYRYILERAKTRPPWSSTLMDGTDETKPYTGVQ
jgi:hypothetical protein